MSLLAEPDATLALPETPWSRIVRWRLLRQFVKFSLVGVLSTIIHVAVFYTCRQHGVPRLAANTVAFILAVTNAFFWNRRWTFRARDAECLRRQYLAFFLVSTIGFLINSTILQLMSHALLSSHGPVEAAAMERHAEMIAMSIAIPVAALWNFSASKWWAFAGEPARTNGP